MVAMAEWNSQLEANHVGPVDREGGGERGYAAGAHRGSGECLVPSPPAESILFQTMPG